MKTALCKLQAIQVIEDSILLGSKPEHFFVQVGVVGVEFNGAAFHINRLPRFGEFDFCSYWFTERRLNFSSMVFILILSDTLELLSSLSNRF